MNIFGIGTMELAVILLVAIIALGPGKTMETARTLGRIMREARRTFTEVMDAASLGDSDSGGRRRDQQGGDNRDGGASGTSDASGISDTSADRPVHPPDTPLDGPAHLAGLRDDGDGDDGVAAPDGAVGVDAEAQRRGEGKA